MSNSLFDDYLARHEKVLFDLVNKADVPAKRIHEAMHYALFPGGKRIRPLLVYLTGQLLNVPINILDIIAASIELTHCYSLVHDDLPSMDNDDFRRSKPSCHRAFDEATAILVGDGLQALAIDYLLTYLSNDLSPWRVIEITRILVLASGLGGMVSGQSLDLTELIKSSISDHDLCQIHLLKTGKLIMACVDMVIASKNVSEKTRESLLSFGSYLGLLFQMEDDYLDRYHSDSLGKERASDLANQKLTFATQYTQKELYKLIAEQHQKTIATLTPFKHEADHLRLLLDQLFERIKITAPSVAINK